IRRPAPTSAGNSKPSRRRPPPEPVLGAPSRKWTARSAQNVDVTRAVYANGMERIQEFAERHHALIRRRDAEHLGVTKSEFDAMVRHGRLERLAHCVYRVPGSVPTWRQRMLAAVWSKGADAVAPDLS